MMRTSVVAAVFDKGGGYRVVIELPENLALHVGPGERAEIVPGLLVDESVVELAELAEIAAKVKAHIKWPS